MCKRTCHCLTLLLVVLSAGCWTRVESKANVPSGGAVEATAPADKRVPDPAVAAAPVGAHTVKLHVAGMTERLRLT
jgi:hypothetical protein